MRSVLDPSEGSLSIPGIKISVKHPKCKGIYDAYTGDYDCGYESCLSCDECKYGVGRKDPEAKCNQMN